jgi:hypothetical protein
MVVYIDHLLKCDLENALAFLGGTLSTPEDPLIKMIRKIYEKNIHHRYIVSFKQQYRSFR